MSCKFCENIIDIHEKYIFDYEADNGTILHSIETNKYYLVVGEYHKLEINYCPNCGDDVRMM